MGSTFASEGEAGPEKVGSRAIDVAAALACALVGLVLAVAPHVAMWVRYGTAEYVSDGDEVLYLAVGRTPYYGELLLRDPFCGPWQPSPSFYAWLQFVPLSVLTRWLGLGPLMMGLVWRSVGGPLLGLSVYVLFRRLFAGIRHPTAAALGCALVCLSDVGFLEGRCFVHGVSLLTWLARGVTPSQTPNAVTQYRVVTPLLNLQALLALVAVMVPVGRRGVGGWLAGSLCLGLCVNLYFFHWTAAVLGLGLYLGVVIAGWALGRVPPQRARTELVFGTAVLLGGMALGAPQILSNTRSFSDPELKPILQRISRGQKLPPGHRVRTQYFRNSWALAKLGFGLSVIVALGAWRLWPVWTTTLAGYLLINSAAVTGLEFENFHWTFTFNPLGEVMVLAGLVLIWDRRARASRAGLLALGALPVLLVGLTLTWRFYEGLHHPEAVWCNTTLRDLRPLRPSLTRLTRGDILAGPREANLALLFGNAGQLFQYNSTPHGSVITDREVHERHALNGWLRGQTLEEYRETVAVDKFSLGEVTDPSWLPEAVAAAREAIFRNLLDDPSAAARLLQTYRPDALLRHSADGPPPRGGPWSLAADGGVWSLWSRAD